MSEDLKELEKWLQNLKKLESIPTMPPQKRTLMDIMGIRKLENPWSSIYAFFLKEDEKHGLGDLFIRTLEEKMNLNRWIEPSEIKIEQPTNNDSDNAKRIDILIKDDTQKRAIIIENKVFHTPQNPFSEYVEYVRRKGCRDIKLVIVSLKKISKKDEEKYPELKNVEYVNLTHIEYMEEIERKIENRPDSFYLFVLKEFIQNIKNITNMATDEQIKFFNSNFEKVLAVSKVYSHIEEDYNNYLQSIELNDSEAEVDKKLYSNEKDAWIYMKYKKDNPVRLSVFLKPNENRLRVILELNGKKTINKINETELLNAISIKEVQFKSTDYWHITEEYISVDDDIKPSNIESMLKRVTNSSIYEVGLKLVEWVNNLVKEITPKSNMASLDN